MLGGLSENDLFACIESDGEASTSIPTNTAFRVPSWLDHLSKVLYETLGSIRDAGAQLLSVASSAEQLPSSTVIVGPETQQQYSPRASGLRPTGSRTLLSGKSTVDASAEKGNREVDDNTYVSPTSPSEPRDSRFAALLALRQSKDGLLLSSTKLPPALPPLPLPVKQLRQRLAARGGSAAPSLPPPLPLGQQCLPDQHSSCDCLDGRCECDLYPDYSEAQSRSSSAQRVSNDEGVIVPPLRRLQFFNSNFKSRQSQSGSMQHPTRGRKLKDSRGGPSLRVLCFCRCP